VLLLGLYVPMALVLAAYGLHRVHMIFAYLRVRHRNPQPEGELKEAPTVLVQVPVFNERAVVRRVLAAVARLEYPRDRLTVQLLDDSTDETVEVGAQACAALRAEGLRVTHVRRENRAGFKAGALAHGLAQDHAELVAIFDADFLPPPHFLKTVVPYFARDRVGMVQARWDHFNLGQNLLTRLQSYFLDGHFILEHTYRHRTGRFFNFNGTAGIWRRQCIDDAGGWSSSSITEDTEISFRAYVKGWEFVYLRDLTVPAELPAEVDAYKGQQHRWAKGYTEVLQQHLGTIWRSPIAFKAKLEATLMLSNHFAFLLFGALTILHLPLVLVRSSFYASPFLKFLDVLGLNLVLLAFFAFYVLSQWEARRFTLRRLALAPLVLGLGMAQMVNSSRAVMEALFGVRSGFVRTPKGGERPDPGYKVRAAVWQAIAEVVLGLYLLASCVVLAARNHLWGAPLNLLVAFGFLYLGLSTLRRQWRPSPAARTPEPEPVSAKAAP
jgi:cellulose synthase/poly-beta-1,6-N-acetylglucosamine synthase-like glycosyltransferase